MEFSQWYSAGMEAHVITTCSLVLVTGLELMALVLVKLGIAMVMRSLSFILLIGWCCLKHPHQWTILVLYVSHGREWVHVTMW